MYASYRHAFINIILYGSYRKTQRFIGYKRDRLHWIILRKIQKAMENTQIDKIQMYHYLFSDWIPLNQLGGNLNQLNQIIQTMQ